MYFCVFLGERVRPNIEDTPHHPMVVVEGQNAALTCVVRNLGESAVVWKKWENGKAGPKILTASETRVTSDERVRVFHDEGKKFYLLTRTSLRKCAGISEILSCTV